MGGLPSHLSPSLSTSQHYELNSTLNSLPITYCIGCQIGPGRLCHCLSCRAGLHKYNCIAHGSLAMPRATMSACNLLCSASRHRERRRRLRGPLIMISRLATWKLPEVRQGGVCSLVEKHFVMPVLFIHHWGLRQMVMPDHS